MKPLSKRAPLFFSFVLIVCAISACKTNSTTEFPQEYKVAGIKGDARYFEGGRDVAHNLKFSDRIAQGAVIQTASGIDNTVMLVPDESLIPADRTNPHPYDHSDKVIVNENSVLKIDKLKTVRGKKIRDARLVLSAGSVLCDVGLIWPIGNDDFWKPGLPGPRIGSIQPQPNAPYFEIGSGNMVVHVEHAVFFLSRGGIVRVLNGAVMLEFSGDGTTKDVFSGQQYDSKTGEITQLEARQPEWPFNPYEDWLRPRVVPPPAYQIPQRPF